ncbi:unnamed protein product [Colias eurytheme]|nr:unnamed protein product [Colias eurytheme]
MNRMEDSVLSPSYFWNCLTLKEECPFFSRSDPTLFYFAVGLTGLYAALLLTILIDLKFYWSVDNLQYQVDYYVNFIKKKINNIQINQRRLVSTQERTDKQLKRSEQCNKIVNVLRGTLASNPEEISPAAQINEESKTVPSEPYSKCFEINNIIDFMQ